MGIFLISVLWNYKKTVIFGFCLVLFGLGIWRHQSALSEIVYPEEGEVVFVGRVVQEPDTRIDHVKLTIKCSENCSRVKGRVLATTHRYPEYQYGDKLKIAGEIRKPFVFDDFNYREYLAKEGVYSVIYWPEIELLERGRYESAVQALYAEILRFKQALRQGVYWNLSPPQSSILGAMILGDKSRMSANLKEKLNKAGVRHITAISGMHIMILAGILMSLAGTLGLKRVKGFYFAFGFLALYILMVGLPSSAVRAGIMGGFLILAKALGRPRDSLRPIIFAAALMLLHNPLLLKWDVGFQLSFLAVMGIIYLMPEIKRRVKIEVLAMTLAAQVFTLPILIYNFGYFSPFSVISNVLIVPLLPFVLAAGFAFGFLSMLSQTLGWVFSWPAWLLLAYIVKIVDWFSVLPSAII